MSDVYPKRLENLIDFYRKLPGIGEKSAERMALATLDLSLEDIELACNALLEAKKNLHPCSICGNLTDFDICSICGDESRNQNMICVVENFRNVYAFEKSQRYRGVYHVLNGLISPMDAIGVDDINLSSLVKRVENLKTPELILALKGSIEGDTTTLYIKSIFEHKDVLISRLSYGLPIGAEIDYLDMMTIDKALDDRKQISE